jgi:hypothetical protein
LQWQVKDKDDSADRLISDLTHPVKTQRPSSNSQQDVAAPVAEAAGGRQDGARAVEQVELQAVEARIGAERPSPSPSSSAPLSSQAGAEQVFSSAHDASAGTAAAAAAAAGQAKPLNKASKTAAKAAKAAKTAKSDDADDAKADERAALDAKEPAWHAELTADEWVLLQRCVME